MLYFLYYFLTFLISSVVTLFFRNLMRKFNIIDKSKTDKRKIHKGKVPYGGGLAIFVSFFLVVVLIYFTTNYFGINVKPKELLVLFLGGLVLMIGGLLDDKYNLKPWQQIWFPLVAAGLAVLLKVGPGIITNPFGGIINLEQYHLAFITLADIIVFFWLFGMMFTTKFLDGLDGLVGGIITIGAVMIFFLSLQSEWYQPDVALLSIVFAGAVSGFLLWNFHPAKIFLGEGGSLFTGFVLGYLAIIAGGKIATTLLVVGIPMLDVLQVIYRRLKKGHPIYQGDSEHLHYRLLQAGLSHRQAVWLLYSISFSFGICTLFLQSKQKLIALLFLFILMMSLGVWVSKKK